MRVLETVLYGRDLAALVDFYQGILGLRLVDGPDELGAGFRLGGGRAVYVRDPAGNSVELRDGNPWPP